MMITYEDALEEYNLYMQNKPSVLNDCTQAEFFELLEARDVQIERNNEAREKEAMDLEVYLNDFRQEQEEYASLKAEVEAELLAEEAEAKHGF